MAKKLTKFKQKKMVAIQGDKVEVWPSNQEVTPYLDNETMINMTRFEDTHDINEDLAKAILDLENDPRFVIKLSRGGCGTKIDDIASWKVPEANLVHARAISFFVNGLGFDQAVVDQCWANIYRKGDYCMPHSHIRSRFAIVYMVEPGDTNPDSPIDGRFYFADPRINEACDIQEHCLTQIMFPNLNPGSMVCFPGPVVHGVNPYTGDRPRITLSWNINRLALPGKPPELR